MSNRSVSDVIISLEEKVDKLIKLVEMLSHNVSVVSNKLNKIINTPVVAPIKQQVAIFAEAVDVKKITNPETIKIDNNNIQVDNNPIGHKRISRKENYTKKQLSETDIGFKNSLVQIPTGKGTKVVDLEQFEDDNISQNNINPNNSVPISQRVVYSDNKSVFMAEVNVLSLPDLNSVHKTRTGGTGKWSSTLQPGKYRAIIKHRDRITKEAIEEHVDFSIDGSSSPLELNPVVLYKN